MRHAALVLSLSCAAGAALGIAIAVVYVSLGHLPPPEVPF